MCTHKFLPVFFCVICCFVLLGCVSTAGTSRMTPQEKECMFSTIGLGSEQHTFYSYCVDGGDQKEFNDFLHGWVKERAKPSELCNLAEKSNNMPIVAEAIKNQKINCRKELTEELKNSLSSLKASDLCYLWDARSNYNSIFMTAKMKNEIIDSEVKSRGVDCVDLAASERMLEEQQATRRAIMMQTLPRTTNCTGLGNMVSCTSY